MSVCVSVHVCMYVMYACRYAKYVRGAVAAWGACLSAAPRRVRGDRGGQQSPAPLAHKVQGSGALPAGPRNAAWHSGELAGPKRLNVQFLGGVLMESQRGLPPYEAVRPDGVYHRVYTCSAQPRGE